VTNTEAALTDAAIITAAKEYAHGAPDVATRSGLQVAFVSGVVWQREHQDDYDAFNGRLGPSDDAWRATLQATINQQAEEIERLREAERRSIQWQPIETAPKDVPVLLGWEDSFRREWEYEAGLYGSTRGGWLHGQATHWMPLPSPPSPIPNNGA
jgi:hypothetical protein